MAAGRHSTLPPANPAAPLPPPPQPSAPSLPPTQDTDSRLRDLATHLVAQARESSARAQATLHAFDRPLAALDRDFAAHAHLGDGGLPRVDPPSAPPADELAEDDDGWPRREKAPTARPAATRVPVRRGLAAADDDSQREIDAVFEEPAVAGANPAVVRPRIKEPVVAERQEDDDDFLSGLRLQEAAPGWHRAR